MFLFLVTREFLVTSDGLFLVCSETYSLILLTVSAHADFFKESFRKGPTALYARQ